MQRSLTHSRPEPMHMKLVEVHMSPNEIKDLNFLQGKEKRDGSGRYIFDDVWNNVLSHPNLQSHLGDDQRKRRALGGHVAPIKRNGRFGDTEVALVPAGMQQYLDKSVGYSVNPFDGRHEYFLGDMLRGVGNFLRPYGEAAYRNVGEFMSSIPRRTYNLGRHAYNYFRGRPREEGMILPVHRPPEEDMGHFERLGHQYVGGAGEALGRGLGGAAGGYTGWRAGNAIGSAGGALSGVPGGRDVGGMIVAPLASAIGAWAGARTGGNTGRDWGSSIGRRGGQYLDYGTDLAGRGLQAADEYTRPTREAMWEGAGQIGDAAAQGWNSLNPAAYFSPEQMDRARAENYRRMPGSMPEEEAARPIGAPLSQSGLRRRHPAFEDAEDMMGRIDEPFIRPRSAFSPVNYAEAALSPAAALGNRSPSPFAGSSRSSGSPFDDDFQSVPGSPTWGMEGNFGQGGGPTGEEYFNQMPRWDAATPPSQQRNSPFIEDID